MSLRAEDATPKSELDAAKARITMLEQALDAMANKSQSCFNGWAADMKLADLLPKLRALAPSPQPSTSVDEHAKPLPPAKSAAPQAAPSAGPGQK